ncbi:MAG: hypothetical protein ACXVP0_02370 [Bacteroidia bacterium]
MEKVLAELKSACDLYKPLWLEWTNYRRCELTQEEINLINAYEQNNFKPFDKFSLSPPPRITDVNKLKRKLKRYYPAFKIWVIDRFIAGVIHLSLKYEWDAFFTTPFSKLFLPIELKAALMCLNAPTFFELLEMYQHNKLNRPSLFKPLAECYKVLIEEEKRHLKFEKEVIRNI